MSEATVQVCRACLELSSKTYPLVGNILNVQEDIASMLEYCISEKLDLGENLPQSVCLPCFKTIRIAYHFLIKFQESQEKLNEQKNEKELEDDDFNVEIIHNYSLKCSQETEDDETSVKDEPNSNDACEKIKIEALDSEMESITFLQKSQPEILEFEFVEDPPVLESATPKEEENEVLVGNDTISVVYKCPVCPEKTSSYFVFQKHVLAHKMEKITCTRCPFPVELDVIEEYFTHYKSVHKYQCDICNKCLSSSYGYQYHMKHHEDIKKYKCPTEGCKKSFFLKNLLKKHLRLHTKSSVHQCDICGAVYKNMGALKYHKKTHEGLRNYLCTLCGNAFYQAVHLRDHMNRHTGNRKFICDICGKSFIIKAQLNKHIIFCTRRNARIKKEIQLKEEI